MWLFVVRHEAVSSKHWNGPKWGFAAKGNNDIKSIGNHVHFYCQVIRLYVN